jgi:Na+/H+-dicarboxylate symporter
MTVNVEELGGITMWTKIKNLNDMSKILIAMLLGAVVGIVVGEPASAIGFIGDIWLNCIKMFLVPIVVCMLVKGISSMDSPRDLGRIGGRILLFYIVTTVIAAILGAMIPMVLKIGSGFHYEVAADEINVNSMPSIGEFFTSMFSTNIFKSFADTNMMQVVIIAVIIGVAIVLIPEKERGPIRTWFISMADLMFSIIRIAMKLAPIGVFCLMAEALGSQGIGLLGQIAKIIGTFYGVCILHFLLIYCGILFSFTGIKPGYFLKKVFPTIATSASTCSSNAVIPVSMDVATKNFDVENTTASLGIPLGATINKDGTAILCGVVLVFSCQAFGIPLSLAQIINIIFVTSVVTCAGSGVPGGGLMNIMIVGSACGIPLDICVMVGGFYRFFDMGTTTLNCVGDMACTVTVDRMEKKRNARLAKNRRGGI